MSWLQKYPNYLDYFPIYKATVCPEIVQKQSEAIINWNGTCNSSLSIIQPALILIGTENIITTPEGALILVQNIPSAWLVHIREVRHGLMYQYPEKFSKIVETFVEVK